MTTTNPPTSIGSPHDEAIPPFEPMNPFCARWGWSRRYGYILAGQKKIRLIKVGTKTYGDNASALEYLRTCPEAEISPPIDRHAATSRPGRPAELAPPPRRPGRAKREVRREAST